MYPILFQGESFILPAWHTFYVLGAIAAYFLMRRYAQLHYSNTFTDLQLSRFFVCCYLGGYFGARCLSIAIDQPELRTASERIMALFSFGPMTFYGGFIGSFVAGSIYLMRQKISFRATLDISVPAGLLALAIGRIGCFLNGDDFGKPVNLDYWDSAPWWSSTFPNLQDGIARYPVQIISSIGVLLIVIVISRLFTSIKLHFFSGAVGIISAVGYAMFRFNIEFLRGDPRGWFIQGALTPSQFISICITLIGVTSFALLLRQQKYLGATSTKH